MKRILILLFFSPCFAFAQGTPSTVYRNQQGLNELKKSNPSAAQDKFLSALSQNPFEARLHYNLGLTFEALGQLDKAQASYQTALSLAQDPETRFSANFNLGLLAQKAQKKDEALQYYQQALADNPESVETKTNIELLTQDQQGKGKGEGEKKDPNDQNKEGDQNQNQDQKGDEKKDDQEGQQPKDEKEKKEEPKQYGKNKPQPQKFKSGELSQGDVNKILGEIKQQEQKIRAEFNRKEVKEKPRDKDW